METQLSKSMPGRNLNVTVTVTVVNRDLSLCSPSLRITGIISGIFHTVTTKGVGQWLQVFKFQVGFGLGTGRAPARPGVHCRLTVKFNLKVFKFFGRPRARRPGRRRRPRRGHESRPHTPPASA